MEMDKNLNEWTGLVGIDRGEISDKKADSMPNRYLYKVKSATRGGIESRWMEAVNAYVREYEGDDPPFEKKYELETGDLVNFFMFADGRGMILGKVRKDI